MQVGEVKGGVEGILSVLELQRQPQEQQRISQEEQNTLSRNNEQDQDNVQTETGVAIQGLGEHIDTMV